MALYGVEVVDKAYFIRLGDAVFLDYFTDVRVGREDRRLHTIMKVERNGEHELRLLPLSRDFIERHSGTIRHSVTKGPPFERVEVTASTQELIDFVKQNARNDEAWGAPGFSVRPLRRVPWILFP